MTSGSGSEPPWPPITWREVAWEPTVPPETLSRSVRETHRGPYRAAVVPPIAGRTPAVTSEALTLADEAAAEIARFDAEVGTEIAPFASVLLRSESASSSQIEDLTSGAKAIAVAALGGGHGTGKRNAELIVGNVNAMQAALDLADQLDLDSVLAMHDALLRRSEPDIAGRLREQQVWIGGSSVGPHRAAFVPPVHDDVPAAMDDLVGFAQRTDLPVLVHTAVVHAHFETIHPFVDGNGRVGRALIHALLRRRELTQAVTVPVSAGLLTALDDYFSALTDYRAGDPSPIVTALASGALTAITNARQLVDDLRDVRARWRSVVRARRDAATWTLVELLLRQPVLDAAAVARELGIDPSNALRPLRPLLEAGVLSEFTGGARNRRWQATEVTSALDAFAARAGRRASPH